MPSFGGVSAYPAAAWNRKTIKNYFKCFPDTIKRPATSVLWGPWGEPVPFIEEFIEWAGKRKHLVEIHMSAETARRTYRHGRQIAPTQSVYQYNKNIINRDTMTMGLIAKRVELIARKIDSIENENTKVVLSVGLEDNLSEEAGCILVDYTTKILKKWDLTWKVCRNPMLRQCKCGRELIEGHGRTFHPGSQHIWNFDGVHVGSHDVVEDISYANALKLIEAANKQYRAVFLWSAKAQGWEFSGQPYEGRTFEIIDEEQTGFRQILKALEL